MPRPRNPIPTYRLHKPSGQAVLSLRRADGTRDDVYLGAYNSPESKQEYERILAQFRTSGSQFAPSPTKATNDLTINEILLAFLRHVDAYYVHPNGQPTSEAATLRHAISPVKRLYGHTLAFEFGPLALKAVRQAMIDADMSRSSVNASTNRIRRVFRWAAENELVSFATYQALTTVQGLRKGRSAAREADPVRPVEGWVVDATLPFLNRQVRAMVELQRLTGMRPGEVVRMSWGEIDRGGELWVYRPTAHKTQYRGCERTIPLGPKAQAILELFANDAPAAFLFSPAEARAERYARLRQSRKTKVQPSQVSRRKKIPKKLPAARYSPGSFANAITKGIEKANRDRGEKLSTVPHWHPNQLRHTYATAVRKRYGLEAAGAALGHSKMSATEVYAERDRAMADRVAAEVG